MIQGLPIEEPWVLETTWLECKNEIGELWDGYLLHAKRNIFKLGVNSSPMPPACPIPFCPTCIRHWMMENRLFHLNFVLGKEQEHHRAWTSAKKPDTSWYYKTRFQKISRSVGHFPISCLILLHSGRIYFRRDSSGGSRTHSSSRGGHWSLVTFEYQNSPVISPEMPELRFLLTVNHHSLDHIMICWIMETAPRSWESCCTCSHHFKLGFVQKWWIPKMTIRMVKIVMSHRKYHMFRLMSAFGSCPCQAWAQGFESIEHHLILWLRAYYAHLCTIHHEVHLLYLCFHDHYVGYVG